MRTASGQEAHAELLVGAIRLECMQLCMPIRLRDIAQDLNLSTMTISKVLRGQTDVSAATKARVLKRMQELNYRPNVAARSLRTGQTYSVGMVVPQLDGAFIPALVEAVSDVFRKDTYSLILASSNGDAENEERECELHLSRQVEALLFCLRDDASDIPQPLKSSTTPVVLVGRRVPGSTSMSVGLKENEVGSIAAMHLLACRSRRVAYMRGRRTVVADQRSTGFREALHKATVPLRPEWMIELDSQGSEFDSARIATAKIMRTSPRPDGIVCSSDLAGAGACVAVREAGFSVPEHVQIIGAGNTVEVCEPFGLTSVDLSASEIGRRAARLALRAIRKSEDASVRSPGVSPALVVRTSTRAKS